jgi:hypothetical protein
MITNPPGYIAVIVSQQLSIVGLVWYVMHLLDCARHERPRYNSRTEESQMKSHREGVAEKPQ